MLQMKSNHYSNYKLTLYREVNNKIRYYTLKLYPTLFGEFLLVKEFGSTQNKKPTRIRKEYFSHLDESIVVIENFINVKMKKGYFQITNTKDI